MWVKTHTKERENYDNVDADTCPALHECVNYKIIISVMFFFISFHKIDFLCMIGKKEMVDAPPIYIRNFNQMIKLYGTSSTSLLFMIQYLYKSIYI